MNSVSKHGQCLLGTLPALPTTLGVETIENLEKRMSPDSYDVSFDKQQ